MPRLALLALVAAALSAAPALAADPAALNAARAELQAAVNHGKAEEIQHARAGFAALLAAEPNSSELNYWVALCGWRVIPLMPDTEQAAAKRVCKESIAACDRALAANARFADALALKAALQALSLRFSPAATMSIGPEMEEEYGRAEGMAPENPRVGLFKAINTLHKPEFIGGGAKKAKVQFAHVLELFAKAPVGGANGIDWGRDDALIWAGICESRMDNWPGALARFKEVLALNPDNAWVRHRLLPEAEKQVVAKAAQ